MKNVTVRLADISKVTIPIGWEGEENHTRVTFYCAQIFDEYPSAVATMAIKPSTGDVYPQAVTKDGNTLVWDVTASNVAGAGSGTFQFTFTQDEEVIKSIIGSFSVNASIVGNGEPPDPVTDWVNEANAVLADLPNTIQNMINDSAGAGDTDKAWSANKDVTELALKADKANPVFTGALSRGRRDGSTSGISSFAFGTNVEASGSDSSAFGAGTIAGGTYTHAVGHYNDDISLWDTWTANTQYSVGSKVKRSKMVGTQFRLTGYVCKEANNDAEFTESKWTEVPATSYLELVGNGTVLTRSNARALDSNGNEYLKGDLYVGCGKASEGGTKVAKITDIPEIAIDDTAGSGDTDVTWSADKITDELAEKYEKPAGGIPATDLASAVQTSLGNADTAYQKPNSGIPASDLASGVIPTVHNVPAGGSSGQVLTKTSGTDYAAEWATVSAATDAQVAEAVDDWLDENVAQETGYVLDRTLLVSNAAAPADMVGDLLNALNSVFALDNYTWVLGSLVPNSGTEMSSSTRIRSEFIDVLGGEIVEVTGNDNCLIVYCYSSSKVYISDSAWTDGNKYSVPTGTGYIRILIRKSSSDETISSSDIETQVARCSISRVLPKEVYGVDKSLAQMQSDVSTKYTEFRKLTDCLPAGNLLLNISENQFKRKTGNSSNVNTPQDSTTRIMMVPYVSITQYSPRLVKVTPTNGYKWIMYQSDGTNYIGGFWSYSWSTETKTVTIADNAVAIIPLIAKSDNSEILTSDFDKVSFVMDIDYVRPTEISRIDGEIEDIEEDIERLQYAVNADWHEFELEWSQGSIRPNTGEELTTQKRIRTDYVDVSSYAGIKATCATGYRFIIDYYDTGKNVLENVNKHGIWISEPSAIYPLPSNVKYIRVLLSINDTDDITPEEGENAAIYVIGGTGFKISVLQEEITAEAADGFWGLSNAFAAMKDFENSTWADRNISTLPSFVHISDMHCDEVRFERAAKAAELLGVDALLATGDFVNSSTDSTVFVSQALENHAITLLPCIGNHDARNQTEAYISEKYISLISEDVDLPQGISNPTYYSKDFDEKNIRVIAVDQYQGQTESGSYDKVHYLQEQITWFVNTLLNTPTGYGVIVLMHNPEETPVADSTYTKFKQSSLYYTDPTPNKPLTEIVDAFISGTTLEKTYSNEEGSTPETFTVNVDFSQKNTGVEFIAFANGHLHADNVTYMQNTTNRQLVLNVACCTARQGASYNGLNDLGRYEKGPTQDAMNVYVIDRRNKSVRIARIGADQPYSLIAKRDMMVIPYADTN